MQLETLSTSTLVLWPLMLNTKVASCCLSCVMWKVSSSLESLFALPHIALILARPPTYALDRCGKVLTVDAADFLKNELFFLLRSISL